MNGRLQQFLDIENLTPARFADIMGLQRSGISHLLSGRNKPGYDFITKFLKRFPHINAEWFLLGVGKPYKAQVSDTPSEDTLLPLEIPKSENPSIFDESSFVENVSSQGNRDIRDENMALNFQKTASEATTKLISQKKIGRITVFYTDGSFDEFFPR